MDPQNNIQQNNVAPAKPEKSKRYQIPIGVFVGILQVPAMWGFAIYIATSPNLQFLVPNFGGFWMSLITAILFILLPLILEAIFLKKTHPYFVRGAAIGTFLALLVGLGTCFWLLYALRNV